MVEFVIDHLDPLGQGVSKRIAANKQSTITFIPKTLPGERGTAKIIKSSKGVEFAELDTISQASPQRIEPECVHYAQCSGCDYLHVTYADEIFYKQAALQFLLRAFDLKNDMDVIGAPERFNYRNRVQLHYRHKYLGLINANSDQVLEVPQCRLPSAALKKVIDQLYADKSWVDEHPGRGHVELYERDNAIVMEWNQPYAQGGFSQVNAQMNITLRNWIAGQLKNETYKNLLDLFSGNGNLSDNLVKEHTLRQMVDMSSWNGLPALAENYLKLDLYDDAALESFQRRAKFKQVDVLLLDPPRKGFPALASWVNQLKPASVVYVSCNPATLSRDLQTLMKEQKKTKYTIERVALLDMFPGTHHFETVVVLKNRK